MNPPNTLGFAHFIAQSDIVAKTLLAILIAMSVASWAIIAIKGIRVLLRRRRSAAFLAFFWNASSIDAVAAQIGRHRSDDPFSNLARHALQAREHHARYGAARLEEAGSAGDFLTRTIRKVLDEETTRLENGLSVLATVGATAPFVGLFGTVWGVYHALIGIAATGSGSLDTVAGPVGEALIMTGVGLAVAIPAVIGYNALVRTNRVLIGRLDGFAFELFTFLSTGQPIGAEAPAAAAPVRPPARPVLAAGA